MNYNTLYAVVCVSLGMRNNSSHIVGLFAVEEAAKDYRDTLIKSAMPGYTYVMHCITTDFKVQL